MYTCSREMCATQGHWVKGALWLAVRSMHISPSDLFIVYACAQRIVHTMTPWARRHAVRLCLVVPGAGGSALRSAQKPHGWAQSLHVWDRCHTVRRFGGQRRREAAMFFSDELVARPLGWGSEE
jgi:hypothetical protein